MTGALQLTPMFLPAALAFGFSFATGDAGALPVGVALLFACPAVAMVYLMIGRASRTI